MASTLGRSMLVADYSSLNIDFLADWRHLPVVDSTNTYARSLSEYPADGMCLIVADRQTGGRGQRGNSFFSDVEGGLWMTVVCPIPDLAVHFRYNRAMIMAVYDTISAGLRRPEESTDRVREPSPVPLRIKWPNDLYWGDRKLCGMLLETAAPAHLIIGVGLNVNIPLTAFPQELRSLATSLSAETGWVWDLSVLLRDILLGFRRNLGSDDADTHANYRQRLYRVGDRVAVGGVCGCLRDVLEDGRLCVEGEEGMQYISSGPLRFLDDR